MKKFGLVIGLSLLTTVGFSQQVSTARKESIKPAENKEVTSTEIPSDSIAVLHSSSRKRESILVPVSKENPQNSQNEPAKAVVHSGSRKPD